MSHAYTSADLARAHLLDRAELDAEAFGAFVLRTRSEAGRELIARRATLERLDWAGLRAAARDQVLPEAMDEAWSLVAARTMALDPEDTDDVAGARTLYAWCADRTELPATHAELLAQLLVQVGDPRLDEVLRAYPAIDSHVRWAVRADALRRADAAADVGAWSAVFNEVFTAQGIEPVEVEAGTGTGPTFAGLRAAPTSIVPDGPLVSVVVPTFRPDDDIFGAVASILAQSWRNLEVIVVDDASPQEFDETLARVSRLDPRVRVVRQTTNGGTYVARNEGVRQAAGEFVTFQDADDWSHPRRVELQVAPLLSDESLLATRSWAVRAWGDLRLTYLGYTPRRVNASSLLMRREEVLDLVGGFDEVRKSADVEFPKRLRAARPGSVRDLPSEAVLAVVQLRSGSLSRADARPGWTRGDRISYRDFYTQWHRQIRSGVADARPTASGRLPFPAPDRGWLPQRAEVTTPAELDVVVLGDWRSQAADNRAIIDEISALHASGLRVGLLDWEAPLPQTNVRRPRDRAVQEILNEGRATLHFVDQDVRATTVLVTDPGPLAFARSQPGAVRCERVAVVTDPAQPTDDWTVAACTEASRAIFGTEPVWLERGPVDGSVDGGAHALLPRLSARPPVRRRATVGPRPVLGHDLPNRAERFPATRSEVLRAYPDDDRFDVRFLNGSLHARGMVGRGLRGPENWLSLATTGVSRPAFLDQLDFYVYFGVPDGAAREALRAAMAAGAVPVVSPELEATLGSGPLYADLTDPGLDLPRTLLTTWSDRVEMRARVKAVQERAAELARADLATYVGILGLGSGRHAENLFGVRPRPSVRLRGLVRSRLRDHRAASSMRARVATLASLTEQRRHDEAIELGRATLQQFGLTRDVVRQVRRSGAAAGELSLQIAATQVELDGWPNPIANRLLASQRAAWRETTPGWLPRVTGTTRPVAEPVTGRVVHVLKISVPYRQSGYSVRGHNVLVAQRRSGMDAQGITALDYPVSSGHEDAPGSDVIDDVPYLRLLRSTAPEGERVDGYLSAWATALTERAAELRPEILHAHSGARGYDGALVGLAAGEALGRPVVYEMRGFFESLWSSDLTRAETSEVFQRRWAQETWCMSHAAAVVTLSETMKNDIVSRGIPAEKVFIAPNGVDLTAFPRTERSAALRSALGLDGKLVFGYVSNVDHVREGHELLVDAAVALRDSGVPVACLVVGDGGRLEALREYAAARGAQDVVHLVGRVPHERVLDYYAQLDVFVVPRIDERAARLVTPLKPFEAMAVGVPLVVSDLPALREVVGDGARGELFRTGDAASLASTLEKLLRDPARRAQLADVSGAWVARERQWQSVGPQYEAVYDYVRATWSR